MSTLSLFESNESSGKISLSKILNNEQDNYFFTSEKNINDIAFFLCRGWWPNIISQQLENSKALKLANLYYNNLISYNLDNFFESEKDLKLVEAIIKVYARNVSSMVSNNTIKKDMESISNIKVSEEKIRQLVNKLIDLFIIDEVEPWSLNLRSKAIIRNSNLKYFSDPSIPASALSTNPNDLFNDLNTFGLLFENLVIRDLKIYAESLDGKIIHYRDNNGLEVDAILKLPNGKWGLIEIKLGSDDSIEKAANNLKKLASIISDKEKYSKPSFMMIITEEINLILDKTKLLFVPLHVWKINCNNFIYRKQSLLSLLKIINDIFLSFQVEYPKTCSIASLNFLIPCHILHSPINADLFSNITWMSVLPIFLNVSPVTLST